MSGDRESIKQILKAIPKEWEGTTFKNSNLLGREGFSKNLTSLLQKEGHVITTEDLEILGNAEDYLRVATNVSTTLEVFLARAKGFTVEQVFTFGSTIMPIIAVSLTSKVPVHLFIGSKDSPLSSDQSKTLELLGGKLEIHSEEPKNVDGVVLAFESLVKDQTFVDGIIGENILYIINKEAIKTSDILVIRKRLATPLTTPAALDTLAKLAGVEVPSIPTPDADKLSEFYAHLQVLSGTEANPDSTPVVCTAGLPSVASLWTTLVKRGGADIVMASTAYGGSSQLADILSSKAGRLAKHTFDIQGISSNLVQRIEVTLNALVEKKDTLQPTTVLFVEIPTNPDMKVPDVAALVPIVQNYIKQSGKELLLLVDSTFAPGSKVLAQFKNLAEELNVLVFISLSKSISRGITTAGALVANHTKYTIDLVKEINQTSKMLDTVAKPDQLNRLIENHIGVEERCQKAYIAARTVGDNLISAVKEKRGEDMPLAFPTPAQAELGFTSSTFSFNLPSPVGATQEQNEALAQEFVDLLCAHKNFKPCVSFGQDNGKVYVTVPATSTQGAIKEEDKAKQAVGGVQLVRISFPPTFDVETVSQIIGDSVATIYK